MKIGRLHVSASTSWDNDDYERAWLLILLWRSALGVAGRLRRRGNSFVEIYLLLLMVEIYHDRDGTWEK